MIRPNSLDVMMIKSTNMYYRILATIATGSLAVIALFCLWIVLNFLVMGKQMRDMTKSLSSAPDLPPSPSLSTPSWKLPSLPEPPSTNALRVPPAPEYTPPPSRHQRAR